MASESVRGFVGKPTMIAALGVMSLATSIIVGCWSTDRHVERLEEADCLPCPKKNIPVTTLLARLRTNKKEMDVQC
ncbi:hypothetical protein BV25DRAFT_1669285 [Artomyces pyxidatus]|uniref:Uncharacterized protein n=1 Tax=Artomyces pyxidatus TaxID=48021 RepID=A0ACB8SHQ5_9AGAM|nr:hypothetical protein BV25DRAFT_1669285 [Artomyces pyxidatus]